MVFTFTSKRPTETKLPWKMEHEWRRPASLKQIQTKDTLLLIAQAVALKRQVNALFEQLSNLKRISG